MTDASIADPDDVDGVELTPESDDSTPELPADDSPIHDEDTIQPGDTNPAL